MAGFVTVSTLGCVPDSKPTLTNDSQLILDLNLHLI